MRHIRPGIPRVAGWGRRTTRMTSGRHHDEAITAAADDGWVLAVRPVGDSSVWSWRRAADELSPTFRSREAAVAWMNARMVPEHGASLPFRRWDGFHHLCHGRSEIGSTVAPMPLNRDQLVEALGLVDEVIDCNAQLHGPVDGPRRAALESSMAARQEKIRSYLGRVGGLRGSDGAIRPLGPRDGPHQPGATARCRALRDRHHQLESDLRMALPAWQMGPQFDERALAIDWIAEWLAEDVD